MKFVKKFLIKGVLFQVFIKVKYFLSNSCFCIFSENDTYYEKRAGTNNKPSNNK